MLASDPPQMPSDVAVMGGGPAGLYSAECLARAGCRVMLFEQKPSVGRKFLVAGRGGLNLTHSEPLADFVCRYEDELPRWREMLAEFGPAQLRAWAEGLGVETYVGTSGRVFPRGQQAAALLRRWVMRVREQGVVFCVNQRFVGMERAAVGDGGWTLRFADARGGAVRQITARAAVFALGGASWPQTGSDGHWRAIFESAGVMVAPWRAANCGFEVEWDPRLLAAAEGLPLKNITLNAGGKTVAGEALITRYGLEGGAVYQLGRKLRAMTQPVLQIDFKPTQSAAQLLAKLPPRGDAPWAEIARRWKLSPAAAALLEFQPPFLSDFAPPSPSAPSPSTFPPPSTVHRPPSTSPPPPSASRFHPSALAERVKAFPLALRGPRPIAEAISSAGGVAWAELTPDLMLRRLPGVFVAGEMIDWEAPTGGYLLQGCFATGVRAARGALRFLRESTPVPDVQPW